MLSSTNRLTYINSIISLPYLEDEMTLARAMLSKRLAKHLSAYRMIGEKITIYLIHDD